MSTYVTYQCVDCNAFTSIDFNTPFECSNCGKHSRYLKNHGADHKAMTREEFLTIAEKDSWSFLPSNLDKISFKPEISDAWEEAYVQAALWAFDLLTKQHEEEVRGRFIKCRGCPTVECTCFTELEAELLDKLDHARHQASGEVK